MASLGAVGCGVSVRGALVGWFAVGAVDAEQATTTDATASRARTDARLTWNPSNFPEIRLRRSPTSGSPSNSNQVDLNNLGCPRTEAARASGHGRCDERSGEGGAG